MPVAFPVQTAQRPGCFACKEIMESGEFVLCRLFKLVKFRFYLLYIATILWRIKIFHNYFPCSFASSYKFCVPLPNCGCFGTFKLGCTTCFVIYYVFAIYCYYMLYIVALSIIILISLLNFVYRRFCV